MELAAVCSVERGASDSWPAKTRFLVGSHAGFPCVSSFLSPPCPSLFPPSFHSFIWFQRLSRNLGPYRRSISSTVFFPFVFHCLALPWNEDGFFFFFSGISFKKKKFLIFFLKKTHWQNCFLSLENNCQFMSWGWYTFRPQIYLFLSFCNHIFISGTVRR